MLFVFHFLPKRPSSVFFFFLFFVLFCFFFWGGDNLKSKFLQGSYFIEVIKMMTMMATMKTGRLEKCNI